MENRLNYETLGDIMMMKRIIFLPASVTVVMEKDMNRKTMPNDQMMIIMMIMKKRINLPPASVNSSHGKQT